MIHAMPTLLPNLFFLSRTWIAARWWWLTAVILATWEAEIGKTEV
jgi:hypothetical protein